MSVETIKLTEDTTAARGVPIYVAQDETAGSSMSTLRSSLAASFVSNISGSIADSSTVVGSDEEKEIEHEQTPAGSDESGKAIIKLSPIGRWTLLAIFTLAQFLDICSYEGLFLYTATMADDLKIKYEASTWILTAYTVTLSAFLPLWGRAADLYSARPVFLLGFFGLALSNAAISFLTNQYAYYILRGFSGVLAAATIPSAFRLIAAVFEPEELSLAYTLFGMGGAMGNAGGFVIAGCFGFITLSGQMAAWRWYFRMMAIIILPFAVLGVWLIPHTTPEKGSDQLSGREKLRRLDVVGGLLILLAVTSLILGLTFGASYGFRTVAFLVPFLLSWPILACFFVWESRLPSEVALVPSSFWRIPNMCLLNFLAIGIYPCWGVAQIAFLERAQVVFHEKPIVAAVRYLPAVVSGIVISIVVVPMLKRFSARWPILVGFTLGGAAYIVMTFSNGELGVKYWAFDFPAMAIGLGAVMIAFLAVNISVMTSVTPEQSGVAGSLLQVSMQIGAVLGVSIQAGLFTIHPGAETNWANVQVSYWFAAGWAFVCGVLGLLLFRDEARPGTQAAERIRARLSEEIPRHSESHADAEAVAHAFTV